MGDLLETNRLRYRWPVIFLLFLNKQEGLENTSMHVSMLHLLRFIQLHFFTIVCNIDQYVFSTLLTFSCSISITYNWMCSILPLKSMPHIIFSPLSMNKISNKNIFYDEFGDYLVHFYCFHAYMYHSFPNSHILINSFEQNYLYLF